MPATPFTSVITPQNPFIGESLDVTVSFDNIGDIPGYGPFVLLYLDSTGVDGNDGLTFDSATYLGSSVNTQVVTLDGSGSAIVNVFGVEQTINIPSDFGVNDTLVLLELPYGSFVPNQPQVDIEVKLNGSNLADLNTPIDIQTQGGFIFGETPEKESEPLVDPPILENISSDPVDTVSPQLATLTKNYLGPEDETATGPNFLREYELVIDVANGQTISNLDITDILPNDLQFVDVVSIVDADGNAIAPGNITEVSTPDDDGLTSLGLGIDDNGVGGDGNPTPGGILTRRISSITGTSGDRDAVLTFSFFVPRIDDGSDSQSVIIDAVTGDDVISPNNAQLGDNNTGDSNNQWVPVDGRDTIQEIFVQPNPNSDDSEHRLEDQSIAIQKTVENISDNANSSGDILEYTLEFQVSDYFAFQNIDILDTFSDGQRFNNSFTPTLTVNEHGSTSSVANFDLTNNIIIDTSQIGNDTLAATDGSTTVTFEVSDELITRSFDTNGILIGGGIPEGGTGTNPLPNNPTLPFGATTGTIKFQTVVQQDYSDTFPSGDSSVDAGDILDNDAIITGELLDVTDVSTPTGQSEDDDTSAEIVIAQGNLYKSIYAINGVIASGADTDSNLNDGINGYESGVSVAPGDSLTYRLTYELPTSDIEELKLTDYFPLPVFNIGTEFASTTFSTIDGAIIPLAGQTKYGPLDTFHNITGAPDPTLSFDAAANNLIYAYGDFDDSDDNSSVVDLLVTVTAEDDPFADGLLLTNQVRQSQENTFGEESTRDAIIQILLGQPDLNIAKGVVAFSSDSTGIDFDPTAVAPTGVTFAAPGTNDSFAGTVTSSGLATTPINSNLTGGLEAGDLVTFALVVENTGGSRAGAFDVEIADTLPDGFLIPTAGLGLNLQVTDGFGDTINFAGLGDPDSTGSDLFGNGIQLDDSNAPTNADPDGTNGGAIDGFLTDTNGDQTNAGRNIALITYDLEVAPAALYTNSDSDRDTPEELLNTATLNSYANIEGGQDFPSANDDASVEVDAPDATKSIVTTSESFTPEVQDGTGTNNNATTGRRKLAIGEIIRYRLVARIPEGEANNFQLRDRLPDGLKFLDDGTAKAAFLSDDAPITSVTPTTSLSNPLNLGLGSPTSFDSNLWIQGSDESTIIPTFSLDDSNIGNNRNIGGNNPDPDNYTPNKDVYFKFGDITNSDRDADDEYVIVEFNALLENRTNNILSRNRKNKFSVNVGVGDNFNTERELALSNEINTRIVEPEITIDKKVNGNDTDTTPVRVDSGDTVTFTVTFSNANGVNNATAFDLVMTDTLPSELNNLQIVSVTTSDAGVTGIVDNSVVANNEIIINVDELPKGESVTVTYTADVAGTVIPDRLVDNTATVTYTSLPGTGTNVTDTQDTNYTGSDPQTDIDGTTPIISGATNGERNGDPNSVDPANSSNNYTTSDSGQLQAAPLVPAKTLISTSESSTSNSDVTIGEIARYRLAVQIPEGQSPNFLLEDFLPAGMVYLDDNTTNVAFISNGGTGGITSDAISGTGLQISGDAPATPTFTLPSSAIAEENPNSSFESGENPIFSLGNLTNADRDTDGEYVVIEFNALVENILGNQDPNTLDNIFEVRATNATTRQSDPLTIDIVEPDLTNVAKTVSTDGVNFAESVTGDAGDILTFQVTFSNTGNTNAFNVNLTDSIADQFQNLSNIQIVDGDDNSVPFTDNSTTNANDPSNNALDLVIASLAAGDSVSVTYTVNITENIDPDSTTNTQASVTYSSLPDTGTASNPTGSDNTSATSGAANGERNGNGGEGADNTVLNNYADSDVAQVNTPSLVAVKSLVETSETYTTNQDVTIGEIVRYRLAVELPEGQIDNLQFSDELPLGLIYLNDGTAEVALVADDLADISSSIFNTSANLVGDENNLASVDPTVPITATGAPFVSGTNPIFNLGTVTNNDNDTDKEYAIVEFNALVENILGNQDSDSLINSFLASADNSDNASSNNVTVNIVEPSITNVSKLASSITGDADDTITYTVTFTNEGNTTAFEVNLTDSLPTELENLVVSSITIKDNNDNDVTGSFPTNNTSTSTILDIEINQLLKDYSVEVKYTADIVNNIAPDTSIANTASVTYSSLPGDDTDGSSGTSPGTANNPTGSDVNDTTSGETNSERNSSSNGEGNTVNNYTDSSIEQVTVSSLNLTKSIANTSVDNDTNSNVLINETITYRLLVEVPEGERNNFQITDTLPNGLTYVDNTAKIALVDNNSSIESNQIDRASNPIAYQNGDDTTINSITPNFSFEPPGTPFTSGEDLVFDLGTVINNDNDSDPEYIVIELDALVDNPGDNQGSLDNVFSIGNTNSNTLNINIGQDYGDAPDTGNNTTGVGDYLTTQNNGGASHYITDGLTIGSLVDADSGTLQNTEADADGGDEDGIISFAELREDANSYTISINVNNDTGSNANLVGWIDFNRNGVFESTEAVSQTVNSSNSTQPIDLEWNATTTPIPTGSNIEPGVTYARFRLSTDSALDIIDNSDSIGTLQDGEVEDYQITIINVIDGNQSSEEITGSTGDDIITAGEGQDTLTGNGGNDQFVFTKTSDGVDIIEDFDTNGDLLDFSVIVSGELNTINFTGTNPFDTGYVQAVAFGSHTMIQVDFDTSDSLANKDVVLLKNVDFNSITASDFIFT